MSPDGPASSAARTGVPGSVAVLPAEWMVNAVAAGAPASSTTRHCSDAVRAARNDSSIPSVRPEQSAAQESTATPRPEAAAIWRRR